MTWSLPALLQGLHKGIHNRLHGSVKTGGKTEEGVPRADRVNGPAGAWHLGRENIIQNTSSLLIKPCINICESWRGGAGRKAEFHDK